MAKATKFCKVCGKEYPYCHTIAVDKFRWQDVACSPECGAIYFAQVAEARGEKFEASVLGIAEAETKVKTLKKSTKSKSSKIDTEEIVEKNDEENERYEELS